MLDDLPPPKIARSDLPSNRLYDFSPEIAKSDLPANRLYDLPSNCLYDLPPPKNHQVRFTLKSSVTTNIGDLRVNRTRQFQGGGKSYRLFEG